MKGSRYGKKDGGRAEATPVVLRASDFADSADPGLPAAQGLYDPALDKDSCGVGFIADIKGRKSHKIVEPLALMPFAFVR